MSDIIIEGKNLSDINQSNFQTVGVRSALYFDTSYTANESLSVNEDVFKHDTLEIHLARLSPDPIKDLLPSKLIEVATIEPWQGRLHFDRDFSFVPEDPNESPYLGLFEGVNNFVPNWQPGGRYYPYFYTGNLYQVDFQNEKLIRFVTNNLYGRISQGLNQTLGVEQRESTSTYVVKDDRFPLGTYTEENKQYWELQTSDPISRESQFAQSRMKVAQTTKIDTSGILTSEEEQFSVDTFTFTERDGVITPLFFYYDKELHPVEYNNATTGKVSMKIELRASGRNGLGELDLYQERLPIRPFLLGFEKDEQMGPIGYPGTGTVNGEGLYYINQVITLRAVADDNSYLLGIYDIPDNNLKSTGGSSGTYTFAMPPIDNQYIAKFRPNPQIEVRARWIDKEGNPFIGDSSPGAGDAKGTYRVFPSNVVSLPDPDNLEQDDEGNYLNLLPTMVPDADFYPEFSPAGTTLVKNTLRPTPQGGSEFYTVEALELTDNYKFKGFTYQSASAEILPLEKLSDDNVDVFGATPPTTLENYYMGGDDEQADIDVYSDPVSPTFIRTFKLQQDFRYLDGKLKIYANFELIRFTIENLNNSVDFENNFADALKYGPFKFASVLNSDGSYPDSNNYSFEDFTSYPAYENNQNDIVRLLISGVNMAYANADYLPSGTQGHLSPLEETGYDLGNFFIERNYLSVMPSETEPTSPSEPLPLPPPGFSPLNPMIGTLSPEEQWQWDGTNWNIVIGTLSSEEQWQWNGTQWTPIMVKEDQLLIEDPIAINHVLELPAPQTLAYAIELAGEEPAPEVVSGNAPNFVNGVMYYDLSPSGFSEGYISGPNGEFKIIDIEYIGQEIELHQYRLVWGPNLSGATVDGNYYRLADNEIGYYRGIRLLGRTEGTEWDGAGSAPDLIENRLVTDNLINSIISTETTSSISYQPLQRGTYVKGFNDGMIETAVEQSFVGVIRFKEDNGAVDADMYGFGQEVSFNMTPSQASAPPEISAFVARANGTLTNSTNIHPTLDLERLGVSIGDWNENGGGIFTYTVPESREATYMAGDDEISLYWKYIEFRIVVSETAEGEQSESDEAMDPQFYVGLNIFSMPGSGGQIFNDFQNDQEPVLVSTGGLINLFNIEETVDENGIMYQEFSQVPSGQRTIVLRAVPSSGGFASADDVGTWSFMADPGVNVDTVGSIQQFWVGNPDDVNFEHHIAIVTFNEEGPVTVKYQWFGDDGGGP